VTAVQVDRLPRRILAKGTTLYRIHRVEYDPRYFGNGDGGRFNPTAKPARGAWYLADDPLGCWVERWRGNKAIARSDVVATRLTRVTLHRDIELADLTVRTALLAGVDGGFASNPSYEDCQALASSLQGQVEGIRWHLRNDPAHQFCGIALFNKLGQAPAAEWPDCRTSRISNQLLTQARDEFGYTVLTDPSKW